MNAKSRFVSFLDTACTWGHWFTHHRPWLSFVGRKSGDEWWRSHCPLAALSYDLDERWGTDVWKSGAAAVVGAGSEPRQP